MWKLNFGPEFRHCVQKHYGTMETGFSTDYSFYLITEGGKAACLLWGLPLKSMKICTWVRQSDFTLESSALQPQIDPPEAVSTAAPVSHPLPTAGIGDSWERGHGQIFPVHSQTPSAHNSHWQSSRSQLSYARALDILPAQNQGHPKAWFAWPLLWTALYLLFLSPCWLSAMH